MRKMQLGLAALFFSLAAVAVTACGDDNPPAVGCSKNDDCRGGEFCNAQKVCTAGCRANTDCTNGGTCNTTTGQCSTPTNTGCTKNEDCKAGEFCNAQKTCAAGCRANTDCTNGGTCDTATGVCSTPQQTTCTPACTGNQVCDNHQGAGNPTCVDRCTYDACNSSQNCNLQTGLCEIAAACDSSQPQPASCSYGQYCSGADVCDYVPKATCTNFNSGGRTPQFNPATSKGPIISSAIATAFAPDQQAFCSVVTGQYKLATVHLEAYNASGTFPSSQADFLALLTYVLPNGTTASSSDRPYARNYTRTNGDKNATIDLDFCLPGTTTSFSAGFVLTSGSDTGNEACVTRQ